MMATNAMDAVYGDYPRMRERALISDERLYADL